MFRIFSLGLGRREKAGLGQDQQQGQSQLHSTISSKLTIIAGAQLIKHQCGKRQSLSRVKVVV
jgi:hypothetical protein